MRPLVSHPINLWAEMRSARWLSSRPISPTVSDTLDALIPILEILGYIRHGYLALASVWSTPACCSIQGISSKWRKWMLTDCTHTRSRGGVRFCHIAKFSKTTQFRCPLWFELLRGEKQGDKSTNILVITCSRSRESNQVNTSYSYASLFS